MVSESVVNVRSCWWCALGGDYCVCQGLKVLRPAGIVYSEVELLV